MIKIINKTNAKKKRYKLKMGLKSEDKNKVQNKWLYKFFPWVGSDL